MPESFKKHRLVAFLFFFTLLSDQLSKLLVVKNLRLGELVNIFPFFNIVHVQNRGVTFGLLSGTFQPVVLIALSLVVVWFLISYARKNENYRLPTSLVIGGAVGNVIDRIAYGSVVDFLDFHLGSYHWPAFNIADSAIVIGVCLLLFISYSEGKNE
ncbi:MAG: signal peptidase II [Alphaproteobacteria bacterium]|nr:signal peptidase II [Alphaproteobacteria bacterium]MCR4556167.1 signal peptidase II [Alphaproteobacteria bacterium]